VANHRTRCRIGELTADCHAVHPSAGMKKTLVRDACHGRNLTIALSRPTTTEVHATNPPPPECHATRKLFVELEAAYGQPQIRIGVRRANNGKPLHHLSGATGSPHCSTRW